MRTWAAVLIAMAAYPALALDAPPPGSGVIHVRSTPCLIAMHKKQPCPLPELAEGSNATQQAAARVNRALYYIDTGDLRSALVEADEALKIDPNDVDTRHLVARLALSTGDFGRAEREIKIALQQRPADADLQATDAARLSDTLHEEALRRFDRIVSEHPDHRFSRESRARLQLTLGLPEKAAADLDVLLADDRSNVNLLALRARANLAAGHPRQSVADLTAALNLDPHRFDLLTARANANTALGDNNAALDDYNELLGPIGGRPNYAIGGSELAGYRMRRALVLVQLKRFADAAADATDAVTVGGRSSLLKAQIFLRQNGFPEVPLDGQPSDELKRAMQACMGLNSCFEKVSRSL